MICAITYMYVLKGQRGRTQEFTKSIAVHVCGSDVILDCLSSKNPVVCKSMTDGMIHCAIDVMGPQEMVSTFGLYVVW